jgi:hypothetical protein
MFIMLEGFKLGIYNHSRKKRTYLISIVINGYVSCCWNFWMNFYNNICDVLWENLENFEMNLMSMEYSKAF